MSEQAETGPDYWTDPYPKKSEKELESFATFVHYGKMYRLTEDLQTVCVGEVPDKTPKPPERPPTKQNGVTKPQTQGLMPKKAPSIW